MYTHEAKELLLNTDFKVISVVGSAGIPKKELLKEVAKEKAMNFLKITSEYFSGLNAIEKEEKIKNEFKPMFEDENNMIVIEQTERIITSSQEFALNILLALENSKAMVVYTSNIPVYRESKLAQKDHMMIIIEPNTEAFNDFLNQRSFLYFKKTP